MSDLQMRILSMVGVVMLTALTGYSQALTKLSGTVTDSSGAVIAGAHVTARNTGTGVVYQTTAGASGLYIFPSLPPAEYELRCQISGFKTVVRPGVVMETGLTKTVDLALEVGGTSETVQVNATAPLLESGNATVGQFIEQETISKMPLDSRRVGSLARLAGGVAFTSENGNLATPSFSMAGGRSENQLWMTDGGVTQNDALDDPQSILNPPAESVQEIKMQSNGYSAEFGRAGGGLVLLTTRSGTNEFHGATYAFFRNDRLNARTFFSPGIAPLRYNTFGVSLGGPAIKNKTFFFVNYEGDRRRTGTTITSSVPQPSEINGDFSQRKDIVVKDPLTGLAFPNNIIPANRLDPVGLAYARYYPAPNVASDPTRAPASNYIVNASDPLTKNFVTARVDQNVSQNDRFFARFFSSSAPQRTAPVFPLPYADPRGRTVFSREWQIVGDWVHNFTPTVLNELRYQYSRRVQHTVASGTGSGNNGKIGLHGVDPSLFATVAVTGLTGMGTSPHDYLESPALTQLLGDSVTWVKGNHQVRTGFEFRYTGANTTYGQYAGGQFSFSDRATGSGLATLLLGWVTTAQVVGTDLIAARSNYWGAYVQDDWKISSRLTANLGFRWDMDTPRREANNRQSGFDGAAINPVSGTPGIVTFAGVNGVSQYANGFDANNVGPRVGLAWRPSNSVSIRTGYGIYYYGQYSGSVSRQLYQGFGLNGSFTSPDGGFTPAFLFKDGVPAITRAPLTPAFGAVPVGASPRLSPDFIEQDHPTAYSQQWNFTVQKELPENALVELAYIGNVGHQLGGQSANINQIPLVNGRGPAKQDQALRLFPQFSNVTMLVPSWGNSTYHAFNARLEKRYSNGLNVQMNYTWSKFLDDVEAANEVGAQANNGYTHIELRGLNKSYSGSNIQQRFIVSSVYDIPLGRDRQFRLENGILEQILGGWGVGVIAELRSGAPYGVLEQTNTSNTFSDGQRPNLLHDPEINASRSRAEILQRYFDTSAFGIPAVGEFGNAAREVGFGPGMIAMDMSAHKMFPLTERFHLTFRTEFINLANHPNFSNPVSTQGNPNFGRITSTLSGSTGRQIEFSLRLQW